MAFLVSLWSRLRPHRASLRFYLIRLVLTALAPLLIFSVGMIVILARQEKATLERGLLETSRALTLALDREFDSSIITLKALATSEHLDSGNLSDFYRICSRILQRQENWRAIILVDASGQQLFNMAKPGGASLPGVIDRETFIEAARSGTPAVGNFSALIANEANVSLYVPVLRQDKVKYVLTAVVGPEAFAAILAQQKLPSDWVGAIFDRKKIIVARTRSPEQFVGKPAGDLMGKAGFRDVEGFLDGDDLEGVPSYAAFTRSLSSGWVVALTLPDSEASAVVRGSLWTVSVGGIVFLLSGIFLALKSSTRISDPIKSISYSAGALARGEELGAKAVVSPIAELDSLGRDMEYAAQLLRERSDERARNEAALREKEEFLQRQADLLDLANEAIFAWEIGGGIVYWNRGTEELYRYPRSDAIGHVSYELLSTAFPETDRDFLAKVAETGEWQGEIQHSTRFGQRLMVESRIRVIKDRNGRRLVLECDRDITNRKRAEQRLTIEHAVTRILAESETLAEAVREVLRTVGEGLKWECGALWNVDVDHQVLRCAEFWHGDTKNFAAFEATCRRFSFSLGVGLPGRVWKRQEPAWICDVATDTNFPGASIAAKENIHGAFAFPIQIGSKIVGVMGFFSPQILQPDIDLLAMTETIGSEIGQFIERKRAEEELSQSQERLRQQAQELERQLLASGRLVSVGELAASMAHEFNNPLGIVLGFAQDLLGKTDPSHPSYRSLQIMIEEAKRCEMLVRDLLEFARPRSEDFILTDVKELVTKTLEKLSNHLQKQNVEVAEHAPADLPRLYADPRQLQQVLVNLCLNSLDAMPGGGKLTVGARLNGAEHMAVTVADTGFGIDAESLPKIFQPFFTAKKRRGLGLGLPICDRIIKAHGGRIEVESRVGQGTIFKIQLPLKQRTVENDENEKKSFQ
jgi:PAS domain S-box-containing protein